MNYAVLTHFAWSHSHIEQINILLRVVFLVFNRKEVDEILETKFK
jgi:hypothetical protein